MMLSLIKIVHLTTKMLHERFFLSLETIVLSAILYSIYFCGKILDRIITNRVLTKQTSKWNKRDFYSVS